MDGKRTYQIEINGVQESIDAVLALNKMLNELENRIQALEKKNIKINTGGSTSSKGTSALSEEAKLEKQIADIDAKREAYSKEIYQNYLAAKDVLNETVKDQKQLAAAERLQADAYSNTMNGIKQKLADLKNIHFTTDISTDEFKKQTQEINTLTQKLKELEEEYGVFSRNVGNYKSAADGFNKISVAVGNTVREYTNYRQAIKELKQERFQLANTLGQESEQYKEIDEAVKQLESDYNDLNKSSQFMDNLLDTMQSFTALASVGQGLSALFGFDDDKIQKSIQKLVALQNVLKGIETIQLQMQRKEGLGKYFLVGSQGVDRFVAKLTGAKVTMNGLAASTRTATLAVRGLSFALKTIGIGFALEAMAYITEAFSKFVESADSAKAKADSLTLSLNALNKAYEERNEALASSYLKGEISDAQYLANTYKEQATYLRQNIGYINDMASALNKLKFTDYINPSTYMSVGGTGYTGVGLTGSSNTQATSIANSFSLWNYDFSGAFKDLEKAEEEFKKCNAALGQSKDILDAYGNSLESTLGSMVITMEDTKNIMIGIGNAVAGEYNKRMIDAMTKLSEAQENVKKGVNGADVEVQKAMDDIRALYKEMNSSEAYQSFLANMDQYIPYEGVRENLQKIIDTFRGFVQSADESTQAMASFWERKRIDKMKDGIDKTLALIELERKETIAKYGDTQDHINTINEVAARKRIEAEKQYGKEYRAVLAEIENYRIEVMQEGLDKQIAKLNQDRKVRIQAAKDNGIRVGELTKAINDLYDKKVLDAKKEWARQVEQVYIDMWNKINQLSHQNAQMNFDNQMKQIEENYQKLQDMVARNFNGVGIDYSDKNVSLQKKAKKGKEGSEDPNDYNYKVLVEKDEAYTKRLEEEFAKRTEARKKYYAENEKLAIEEENKLYAIQTARTVENLSTELRNLQNGYKKEDDELKKHLENGKITQQQYDEAVKRLAEERRINEAQIADKYHLEAEQKEREHEERLANIKKKSDDEILENYRDFINKLSKVDTSRAVTDGAGFISVSATKRRNNQLIALYSQLRTSIEGEISRLEAKLKATDLTEKQKEDIEKLINQYREMAAQLGILIEEIQQNTEDVLQKKIAEVTQYIQAVAQSFQDIMSALWDAQDNEFDKEQEELDKWNDELDDALQKQEDIINEHKNNVNSIEDELATARGDRRQHLIDQLNAEMAAERAAQKEKRKIQKQQEAAEKKQDKLELDRKKAQYKRDLLQAIVNGAMAVTYAAINKWPIPAIPMMALAAGTTAAQIAIMSANKPYAKGGLLEGPSHKNGGIPVGNTGIEVEGKEYVIRKSSTAQNIELLDYINKSQRKLSLDDFIDFYTKGKVKKSFASSPNSKFAEGGALPTLNNDYTFDDRLLTAFEDYSNRPVQVAVVDINKRQEAVRSVQVLSGLEV